MSNYTSFTLQGLYQKNKNQKKNQKKNQNLRLQKVSNNVIYTSDQDYAQIYTEINYHLTIHVAAS
jgi:hypothetical protein